MKTPEHPIENASACIVCGRRQWSQLYGPLARCSSCGFVRADTRLSPEAVAALYGRDYFFGGEYGDYLADAEAHRRNAARRLREIQGVAGSVGSIFEIGCAHGFWLERCSQEGLICAGTDVCSEAVDYAVNELGQQAWCVDFLDLNIRPGEYQAFCMWDVIEHLAHPERYTARILDLLPAGGWFFATTGDIGSKVARLRRRRWRLIHPPTHLHYFSSETMQRFLAGQGFDVVRIRSAGYYRSVRSVLSGLHALSKEPLRSLAKFAGQVLPAGLQDGLGCEVDLGDIMMVFARRPTVHEPIAANRHGRRQA